jgi:DinB superfamily
MQRAAVLAALGSMMVCGGLTAQEVKPSGRVPPRAAIASEMDTQLIALEGPFVAAAEAMPANKYSFAPTDPGFAGVRTFALQVKHVATANYVFFGAILGEPLPPGVSLSGATNGPGGIRTKADIVKYLKESFALGHRAMSSLTSQNATARLAQSPVPTMTTRLALAAWACSHAWDHYGQMVEYLRMNGIIPPASRGQPPANPPAKRSRT